MTLEFSIGRISFLKTATKNDGAHCSSKFYGKKIWGHIQGLVIVLGPTLMLGVSATPTTPAVPAIGVAMGVTVIPSVREYLKRMWTRFE